MLNLEFAHGGRSGFQPMVGGQSFKRPPWKLWILRWIFAVDFWSQNTKEKSAKRIRRKIRQPKTKNPPAHDPPEIRQPGPKIRCKTYQQIRLSNLQVHAGFLIEKFALGGVFRAWILRHSLAAFWAWSRLPC